MTKKRPAVHLRGTATYKRAKTKVNFEVKITDAVYEFAILTDDIRAKRLWLDSGRDKVGWIRLLYSADGPTGDPISVGRIRFEIEAEEFDPNFRDFSNLKLNELKEE
jgi:hypothetical protein